MTMFSKTPGDQATTQGMLQLESAIAGLRSQLGEGGRGVPQKSARTMLSMEKATAADVQDLNNTAGDLLNSLRAAVGQGADGKSRLTYAQERAAVNAGILHSDWKGAVQRKLNLESAFRGDAKSSYIPMTGGQGFAQRNLSMEAYDETANNQALAFSMAYNLEAVQVDAWNDAFWPTIVITSDQVGISIEVDLMMVYKAKNREIDGNFRDYDKVNLLRAVADATILQNDQTRIYPIHRPETAHNLVDETVLTPRIVEVAGESLKVQPIKFGVEVDALGISQTDSLIARGVLNNTDSLDPYFLIKTVAAKVGDDVLLIDVRNLPLNNFIVSGQNNYKVQNLNFATKSVLLNEKSLTAEKTELTGALALIKAQKLAVRLELVVTGNVNVETGKLEVFGNRFKVATVVNEQGERMPLTEGVGKQIADAVAGGELLGYEPDGYRSNLNRRQGGQLLDVTKYTQTYEVPLRSPLNTIHPTTTNGSTDAADVRALIQATRTRMANEGVTALLEAQSTLAAYCDVRDVVGEGPELLGVGRFYTRSSYVSDVLDVAKTINSIESHKRAADLQAVLVNKLRDMVYTMYRDSEFQAGMQALGSAMPTVVIGTDPITARYINLDGELRTLGGDFPVKIVHSLDTRVIGKVFVAFSMFDETRGKQVNPLSFGNTVWASEVVLTANISRGDTFSRETLVAPRYRFFVNSPVMGYLEVQGITESLERIPLHMIVEQGDDAGAGGAGGQGPVDPGQGGNP